jgi:hypothetical protein
MLIDTAKQGESIMAAARDVFHALGSSRASNQYSDWNRKLHQHLETNVEIILVVAEPYNSRKF